MIQTKHFYCDDVAHKGEQLDDQINQFIINKTATNNENKMYFNIVDIKHSTSNISGETSYFTFSALVIYEEGALLNEQIPF